MAKQGEQKTPASSGYRLQQKFEFTEMQTLGHQFFIGTGIVNSRETVLAKI